ncbi:translation initiation factor eIF4A [Podila epicladia]|nr:translation initiation factor eIF4A [Podila epicladia]
MTISNDSNQANQTQFKDTQYYVQVAETAKIKLLLDRANDLHSVQTLVVVNTPRRGHTAADELQAHTPYDVSRLLDPASQGSIDSTVDRFRRGNTQILVALHEIVVQQNCLVQQLADLVINCDMPMTKADYLRRCSIPGADPAPYVISFVTPGDEALFADIKAIAKKQIKPLPENVIFEAQYDAKKL